MLPAPRPPPGAPGFSRHLAHVGRKPVSAHGHISWVPAAALSASWLPAHFEPRFVALDREFSTRPERFIRLGDIVDLASLWPPDDTLVDWVVVRRGEQLAVEAANRTPDDLVLLPDECLLLHPLVFQGQVATTFWSSSLAGGRGATSPTTYALVPRSKEDAAWLDEVLREDAVSTQLERASAGGLVPLLRRGDVLDVMVPNLPLEQRLVASQRVRARSTRAAHPAAPKQRVLTGASHEERLEQFERLLFEERFVLPGGGFYVQTVGESGNRWTMRALGSSEVPEERRLVTSPSGSSADEAWRVWYSEETAAVSFQVLNSFAIRQPLPDWLLHPVATAAEPGPPNDGVRLPAFVDFMAAVESARDGELDLDVALGEAARVWEVTNPGVPLTEELFGWLRRVFRPVLALRVPRGDKTAGAFLLVGPDQLERPADVASFLELQGQQLAAVLEQPSEIADDAARRESIRRLSWMMHQLNGPMMLMRGVIQELSDFVGGHPEVADQLLPDPSKAKARAAMTHKPVEEYRLGHRLAELAAAAEGIRRLQYQIRRYKNAQGELQITTFAVKPLLEELAAEAHGQLQEAAIRLDVDPSLLGSGDRALIRAALAEVIGNACRECRERRVDAPLVTISGRQRRARVQIVVEDNGLPLQSALPDDPFAEDASTYRVQGKGSGLGLAIVKETFARHGGQCSLRPNHTADGARYPGVQFSSDIAAAAAAQPAPGESDA